MHREAWICVMSIISIIVLNIITGNYTSGSVSELNGKLYELREEITEENIQDENINKKAEDIQNRWGNRHQVLAYYLEHDELEKITRNITLLKSAIHAKEYSETISKIDESIFSLEHIKEKNEFDLRNIF